VAGMIKAILIHFLLTENLLIFGNFIKGFKLSYYLASNEMENLKDEQIRMWQ
jgi:hypothetical protein